MTPIMGAELLTTGNYMFTNVEAQYFKPQLFKENKWTGKGLNIGYRLGKTLIIDKTLADFFRVFQHEVFGHGSRNRAYDYNDARYQIGFPSGGGLIVYGTPPQNRVLSIHESIMRGIGGTEGAMILSNTVRHKWLESGLIQSGETYLFATSFISASRYVRSDTEDIRSSLSDIQRFFVRINTVNGEDIDDTDFDIDYLKKRSRINFFNPLRYYAIYVLIKDYIILGKEKVKLPMIPIGNYQYLPLFRTGFNPFGTELYVEQFLRNDQSLNSLYFRLGDDFFGEHWGGGVYKSNIINNNWLSVDANLDIWNQPELILGGTELETVDAGWGGAMKVGLSIKLFRNDHPVNFYTQIVGKTAGYLEGEYLKEGVWVRAGLSLVNLN